MSFLVGLSAVKVHENLVHYNLLYRVNLLGKGTSVSLSIFSRFSIPKFEPIVRLCPKSKIKPTNIIFFLIYDNGLVIFRLLLYGRLLIFLPNGAFYRLFCVFLFKIYVDYTEFIIIYSTHIMLE